MKKQIIIAAGVCMAMLLMTKPVTAEAGNTVSIKDVTQQAGVSFVLMPTMTTEEYIAKAEEARESQWGYTNLGIANVDNNLNVRETPGETGKLFCLNRHGIDSLYVIGLF